MRYPIIAFGARAVESGQCAVFIEMTEVTEADGSTGTPVIVDSGDGAAYREWQQRQQAQNDPQQGGMRVACQKAMFVR